MNYNKLRGRIVERFGTISQFAEALGTTRKTVDSKLHDRSQFTSVDIAKWSGLLEIQGSEIGEYFFSPARCQM